MFDDELKTWGEVGFCRVRVRFWVSVSVTKVLDLGSLSRSGGGAGKSGASLDRIEWRGGIFKIFERKVWGSFCRGYSGAARKVRCRLAEVGSQVTWIRDLSFSRSATWRQEDTILRFAKLRF